MNMRSGYRQFVAIRHWPILAALLFCLASASIADASSDSARQARIAQIRAELAELRSLLAGLRAERARLAERQEESGFAVENEFVAHPAPAAAIASIRRYQDEAEQERLLEELAVQEAGMDDPDLWSIRHHFDTDRLRVAARFTNSEDIRELRGRMAREQRILDGEMAIAMEEGDIARANTLAEQLEVKKQVIDELLVRERIAVFRDKPAIEQETELETAREAERAAHIRLVQAQGELRELEEKVNRDNAAWLGIGRFFGAGASEEDKQKLAAKKDEAAVAEADFVRAQEEMLLMAVNAGNADHLVKKDIVEHAERRLVAQHNIVAGKTESLGVAREETAQKTAENLLIRFEGNRPDKAVGAILQDRAVNAAAESDLDREDDKLLRMAASIKKASMEEQDNLLRERSAVDTARQQGMLSEEEHRAESSRIGDAVSRSAIREEVARVIEDERTEVASLEESRALGTGIKTAWNEETHGTKTGAAYKGYTMAKALTGDVAGAVKDIVANTTDGALATSKETGINVQIANRQNQTREQLRALRDYNALSMEQKQQIRNHELRGEPVGDEQAAAAFRQLDEKILSQSGARGVNLLTAGHQTAGEEERIMLAIARSRRETERAIRETEEGIKKDGFDPQTGKSLSYNPVRWVTGDILLAPEAERKTEHLTQLRQQLEHSESLRSALRHNVATEEEKQQFLRTDSFGLKANAEIARTRTDQKLRELESQIALTSPADATRISALRQQKEQIAANSAAQIAVYERQSGHLRAEDLARRGNIAAANAVYQEMAAQSNDPQEKSRIQGMINANREYQIARKNNEMSAYLAENVTQDVVITAATGGGSAAIAKARAAGQGALSQAAAGMRAYARTIDPTGRPTEVISSAKNQVLAENIARESGLSADDVSSALGAVNFGKNVFKGQRANYRVATATPRAEFDTIMRNPTNRALGMEPEPAQARFAEFDVAVRPRQSRISQEEFGRIVTPGKQQFTREEVLRLQQDTTAMRELKKKPESVRAAFNETLQRELYGKHDHYLVEDIRRNVLPKMPQYANMSAEELNRIQIKVDDFRTPSGDDGTTARPGAAGRSPKRAADHKINTDRDYRVLIGDGVELDSRLWEKSSQAIFAQLSDFKRPANWDSLPASRQEQLYRQHHARFSQMATDKTHIEASRDYSDQHLSAIGQRTVERPVIGQIKGLTQEYRKAVASGNRAAAEQITGKIRENSRKMLLDPEGLGRMYEEKVRAAYESGDRGEAVAQAKKAAESLPVLRQYYQLAGARMHQLDPKVAKALRKIDEAETGFAADPARLDRELREIGFNGLPAAVSRIRSEIEVLKMSPVPHQ